MEKNDRKTILITGASSGIGKASAERLIAEGYTVYGGGRNLEGLQFLAELGGHVLQIEMTDYSTLENAVNTIISQQGRIDVLFNNAGFGLYGAVEDIPIEEAKRQFDVNLFGLAKLTQLVLPHMRKQQKGLIINTSSMGGKIYTPLGAWYHATKHALEGWSDCLRLDVAQFGINVVILEPGAIRTNFGNVMVSQLEKYVEKSAYSEMIKMVINASQNAYAEGSDASDPSVIADVVVKAVKSKNPKTRYVAGAFAKQLLLLRKFASDRQFDNGVMKTFSKNAKNSS